MKEGGSTTFMLLHQADAAIKIFRHAESPGVIKICFSAEPEEVKESIPPRIVFTEGGIKEYLDSCIDYWRGQKTAEALIHIDAYQSMRTSLFGELKPKGKDEEETKNPS